MAKERMIPMSEVRIAVDQELSRRSARQEIAMHLMAGMMADSKWELGWDLPRMAELAVSGADALLAALKDGESND